MARKRKSEVQKVVKESPVNVPPAVLNEDGTLYIEGFKYNINDILTDSRYEREDLYKVVQAKELTLTYFRLNGTSTPILVDGTPQELGMEMPDKDFLTMDKIVSICGKSLEIDVIKVGKFETIKMTLEDFGKTFSKPPEERDVLLNSLSLEFSYNKLSKYVRAPSFVKDMDWVIRYWPDILKINQLKYIDEKGISLKRAPNVHHYCLVSMKHSYTDFHMDFGGTSVWYHVLTGKKVFWLIPPTKENIKLHEEFMRGCKSAKEFLGETAKDCFRISLLPGQTFLIPSGFIHAVYTAEDSIVFGGNYLHSLSIPLQLDVHRSEARSRVGEVYKFPFFNELLWYSVAGFVEESTGLVFVNPALKKRKKICDYDEDFFNTTLGKFKKDNKNLVDYIKFLLKDENSIKKIFNGKYFLIPDELRRFDEVRSGKTDNDSFDDEMFEQIVKKDVIDAWSKYEIDGFVELHKYLSKPSDKLRKVFEPLASGITRPLSLLKAFYKVIEYAKAAKNMLEGETSNDEVVNKSDNESISEEVDQSEELEESQDNEDNLDESQDETKEEEKIDEDVNASESMMEVSIEEDVEANVNNDKDEESKIDSKCDEEVDSCNETMETKMETSSIKDENVESQIITKNEEELTIDGSVVTSDNPDDGSKDELLNDINNHKLEIKVELENEINDSFVDEESKIENTNNSTTSDCVDIPSSQSTDIPSSQNTDIPSSQNTDIHSTENDTLTMEESSFSEEGKVQNETLDAHKIEENIYKPEDNVLKLGGESNSSMYRRRVSDQRKKVIPTASKTLKEKVEWQGFSGSKISPKIPRNPSIDISNIPEKKIRRNSDTCISDMSGLVTTPMLNHSGFLLEPRSKCNEIHKVDYPKTCTKTTADIINKMNELHKILEANVDHR
uniref:Glycos_transf_1 domain-containing protein n=1 Tax=Strongyloides stercoralis TaxID=6248 RepID=A0A0K0ERT8_STRER